MNFAIGSNAIGQMFESAGAVPLTAGSVSFHSCGPAGGSPFIRMTATDATGGTSPYTYVWKRSVDGGAFSTLSNGGGVSGATTRDVTDGSATAGHVYVYKVDYTDSAVSPATATSAPSTAQVYSGGTLGSIFGSEG